MKNKLFICVFAIGLATVGCQKNKDTNVEGFALLRQARVAMAEGNTAQAKALIDTLRSRCPMAFNAREDGILVLDSANLFEARLEVDSIEKVIRNTQLSRIGRDTMDFNLDEAREKIKFFEKKIQHDIQNKKLHH